MIRPPVIVAAVPSHIGHGVDRRRAPDYTTAVDRNATPRHRRRGLGDIHTDIVAAQHIAPPGQWDVKHGIAIPAAGLEQDDANVAILREPMRQGASGGTGTHNYVITDFTFCDHVLPR